MKQPTQKKIQVTQPYLPNIDKFKKYIDDIYERSWLTNNGPLVQQLTSELSNKLGVKYILLVSNGTIALQLAYKLKLAKQSRVLTTPFTFAATVTSLLWDNHQFIFSDIDRNSWNLCPNKVEDTLKKGKIHAILPVNIFGMPCDLDAFDYLSKKYNVPVIYDSAHAFGSSYKARNLFDYGDIHCISFHATKLFQTVEGGALIFRDEQDFNLAKKLVNFGQNNEGKVEIPGINGKMSELHAAMGLCVLDDIEEVIQTRQHNQRLYREHLKNEIIYQSANYDCTPAPIYMPIKLSSQESLKKVKGSLAKENILARHYFSSENLTFLNGMNIPKNSLEIASKVLCLPLSTQLSHSDISTISTIVNKVL